MHKRANKNENELVKKISVWKICKVILFCFSAAFLLIELFIGYYFFMGHKKEIKDLNEEEIQQIKDIYNLELSDTDEIVSISFMARGVDTFYVLKIKTSSPEEFCTNNQECFPEQQELKTLPFLFSSLSYVPLGGEKSIYYSQKYVYISSWSYGDRAISDLYFELENSR